MYMYIHVYTCVYKEQDGRLILSPCIPFPQHGKPRFVVLFTDYLLVLKARRPSVPSKLGGVFNFQSSRIDWFSDLEYAAKKVDTHVCTCQFESLEAVRYLHVHVYIMYYSACHLTTYTCMYSHVCGQTLLND